VSGVQGQRATEKEGGTASCQRKEESRHVGGRRSRITNRKVTGGHAFRLTRDGSRVSWVHFQKERQCVGRSEIHVEL
jgi:hypothetical protein